MDAAELAFAGAAQQAALIRAREVSAREAVQLYLERIERLDCDAAGDITALGWPDRRRPAMAS